MKMIKSKVHPSVVVRLRPSTVEDLVKLKDLYIRQAAEHNRVWQFPVMIGADAPPHLVVAWAIREEINRVRADIERLKIMTSQSPSS